MFSWNNINEIWNKDVNQHNNQISVPIILLGIIRIVEKSCKLLDLVTPGLVTVYMGQVTELWLSCYLVLLSIDSKTRYM